MNAENTRIVAVKAMEKTNDGLNPGMEYTRDQVIGSIEQHNQWYTCRLSKREGNTTFWNRGEEIHIIQTRNGNFIRTDRNQTELDNLGELPDF